MFYVFQLCLKFELILRSFSTDSSFNLTSQQESGKWPDEHICEVWYIKCIRASVQRGKSFFLNDSEIDNHVRRMELARKELFSNQQENKQLCRRNRKLAMSLEKYKKIFKLKQKSRRLQKSWSDKKQ